MKTLSCLLVIALFISTACQKNEVTSPKTSACIEAKIGTIRIANIANTSVMRYTKDNEYYWLFDTGSAFDAPKYMLNASCDTLCKWCRCSTIPPCQSDYDLNASAAVIIWKY